MFGDKGEIPDAVELLAGEVARHRGRWTYRRPDLIAVEWTGPLARRHLVRARSPWPPALPRLWLISAGPSLQGCPVHLAQMCLGQLVDEVDTSRVFVGLEVFQDPVDQLLFDDVTARDHECNGP
jgi:hypothetical protein